MRLLIVHYLASLRERGELDAMLPVLLTELGFNVLSRPRRGTAQRGVDIAATRWIEDAEVLYLFSIKAGDLTRAEWNSHDQALRPSLDEIKDSYLQHRVWPRYRNAKVIICICLGGEIREEVRDLVAGYISTNTTDRISYEEWNGSLLADLLLKGLLREQVLPAEMRTSFRKAVALVDEPDVSYQHFRKVADQLLAAGRINAKSRILSIRQLSLCAWVLFVWARDAGNVESAYKAVELALLYAWDLGRVFRKPRSRHKNDSSLAIYQLVDLYIRTASELIDEKIQPVAAIEDGLSSAVSGDNSVDTSLALFEILGRIGLYGIWLHLLSGSAADERRDALESHSRRMLIAGLTMIANNEILLLPIHDDQAIDVAIFLQLALVTNADAGAVRPWIQAMINRLIFTIRLRRFYPLSLGDYRNLIEHSRAKTEDDFKDMTCGSTLIPLLALWARPFGLAAELKALSEVVAGNLSHCTQQLWTADQTSEDHLYVNDSLHGCAIANLPIDETGSTLFEIVSNAATHLAEHVDGLSAVRSGVWPIVLMACRHYRLPVPPGFWVRALTTSAETTAAS